MTHNDIFIIVFLRILQTTLEMRKTSQTKVVVTMALVLVVVVVVLLVVAARERKRSWANGARFCPRLLQQTGLD